MKTSHPVWRLTVGVAAALTMVLGAVSVAYANHVPVTTTCASTGTLADGTTVNTVNINVDPTKLRTKDAVEVLHICNAGAPGFTSGWHYHTGPVIVNVTAGELTFYAPDNCAGTTVTAGHAYIESTGSPILAHNESAIDTATWITTQIIPVGAATKVDLATGFCGVS
ncbi:MAG: hypothetical protein E6F95_01315 [Actinobacteria bacterium]|nr:MAG: hypothetical protein E6F95_01315 [Actinomycetota bacterium]